MNRVTRTLSQVQVLAVLFVALCSSGVCGAPTVATPTFSLAAGSYTGRHSLTIRDTTSGATICYTTKKPLHMSSARIEIVHSRIRIEKAMRQATFASETGFEKYARKSRSKQV